MPIETNDLVPFLEWLLGPGWRDGRLFQPLGLAVAIAAGGASLASARVLRRCGSGR